MNKMTNDIPTGHTKEDIKAVRETSYHEVWGD